MHTVNHSSNLIKHIHPEDNIVVMIDEGKQGQLLSFNQQDLSLQQDVPRGHKVAIQAIRSGEPIIKYGFPIGIATQDIQKGEHVHLHNLRTTLNDQLAYQYQPIQKLSTPIDLPDPAVQLYRRQNGEVGIRNELWIIPTVGCVNAIAQRVREAFLQEIDQSCIDGVHVFPHPYGCSQLGDDHQQTRKILQNMLHHPNAGAVLVIGLGCENNQISTFRETLGSFDENRVRFMVCQSERDEHATALQHLHALYAVMKHDQRSSGRLSELRFGLECGGSDGFSGITANPLLGLFSDFITQYHGTSVLTEVPEMFGAEQLLMNRADNEEVFQNIVSMINGFKQYFVDHQQPIYENPSPGNNAGGISTLEEKSLGCVQKSGRNTIVDVIPYAGKLKKRGLNLLNAPGNDAVATTALAAAGCHMVLFSTGRGTPYGGFVPTFKIASNTQIATLKPHWIDFDAGLALAENCNMLDLLAQLIEQIVGCVNGQLACNERLGFRDLTIFKTGVTL